MLRQAALVKTFTARREPLPAALAGQTVVETLTSRHTTEVLNFLAARPIHTVYMAGLIRDNGLVSPLNRGSFYGCRDSSGELQGVGLIGHAMLFETRSDAALATLAGVAKACPEKTRFVMGEAKQIEKFWHHYSPSGADARLLCSEMLLELRWPVAVDEPVSGLRPATLADLELIVPVHAEMSFAESGVNPLETDPDGFRQRCARRVEQGRVWVWVQDGQLIFKADVISDTPEVVYVEGIYVDAEARGRGVGRRCMSHLCRQLLAHTRSVGVIVNVQNAPAQKLYKTVGFKHHSYYDTIYL